MNAAIDNINDDAKTAAFPFDPPPTPHDAILLQGDLAIKIHVSERTLEGWRVTGEGPPFVKIGPSKIGYIWGSALAWLKSRERSSTSQELAAA